MTQNNSAGLSRQARAAAWYATTLQWPVFPLKPRSNRPPLIEAWPERATTDGAIVAGWWATWPHANIGLHCAGFLVLDVDPRHDGPAALAALLDTHGRLPPTAVQRTPGGGWHYVYRCTAPIKNTTLARGLDVKAKGGCITLAPSVRPDGVYRWARGFAPHLHGISDAPAWLVALVMPLPRPLPLPRAPLVTPDRLTQYAMDRDLEMVRTAPPGSQNETLYVAARKLGRFAAQGLLDWGEIHDALAAASAHHDDPERQRLATISSGLKSRSAV